MNTSLFEQERKKYALNWIMSYFLKLYSHFSVADMGGVWEYLESGVYEGPDLVVGIIFQGLSYTLDLVELRSHVQNQNEGGQPKLVVFGAIEK